MGQPPKYDSQQKYWQLIIATIYEVQKLKGTQKHCVFIFFKYHVYPLFLSISFNVIRQFDEHYKSSDNFRLKSKKIINNAYKIYYLKCRTLLLKKGNKYVLQE